MATAPQEPPRWCSRRWCRTLFAVLAAVAVWRGVELRRALYEGSDAIRVTGDIANAWAWGNRAADEGIVALYDRLVREQAQAAVPDYKLDYPPVRLWLVSGWARWTRQHWPEARAWQHAYAFSRPMLQANTAATFLAALAVVLIVRRLPHGCAAAPGRPARATGPALAAGLALWFNPAILWDTHCFPQWDLWGMPFYLFALLAALRERWTAAGLLLGAGALVKGQILWGAPVLALWPLFAGNGRATLKVLAGTAAAVAALTLPWSVRTPCAWAVLLSLVLAGSLAWRRLPPAWGPVPLLATFTAGCAAGALWLGGTASWFQVGFVYGASRYNTLFTSGVSNLCTLLQTQFGVQAPWVKLPLPGGLGIQVRYLLAAACALALLVCARGAAAHARHHPARCLAAVTAPFVLVYTLMPQMHDRYLVWGVAATALLVGCGLRWALLHALLTGIMWAAIAYGTFHQNPRFWPAGTWLTEALHPRIAWLLLAVAAALLCAAAPPGPASRLRSRPAQP